MFKLIWVIVVMSGSGMSVSSGATDFKTKEACERAALEMRSMKPIILMSSKNITAVCLRSE